MDLLLTGCLALVALGWLVQGAASLGLLRLPRLEEVEPMQAEDCPPVSILFAARDEARELPRALATMLSQDLPTFEVIAVDDRSTDETGRILDEFSTRHAGLEVVHLDELPPGWLGKPHALQQAYRRSTGDWLVFTDADVRFAPDIVRRSLALAERQGSDHVTLFASVDMHGFWETVATTFFGLGLALYSEAWKVSDPRSRAYCGVGAFQMIRRSTYEAIGTHRRLAMEVIDDMKLGKLVKMEGFRSAVAVATRSVTVRWQDGFGNIIRGTTKNLFAGANFSVMRALLQLLMLLAFDVLPFIALPLASPAGKALAGASALIGVIVLGGAALRSGVSALYGLTLPLGALILMYMLARSTLVTLRRGGVTWRGTFYPLEDLRKGLV